MAHDNPPADAPALPRCAKRGVYLVIGFAPGGFLLDLKRRFNWTIGRSDQGIARREWDAVVTSCAAKKCPRCNTPFCRRSP